VYRPPIRPAANVRRLRRGLTDENDQTMGKNGGVILVNFYKNRFLDFTDYNTGKGNAKGSRLCWREQLKSTDSAARKLLKQL